MELLLYLIASILVAVFEFFSGIGFEQDPTVPGSTFLCIFFSFLAAGVVAILYIWVQPTFLVMIVLLIIAYLAFNQGANYGLHKRFSL